AFVLPRPVGSEQVASFSHSPVAMWPYIVHCHGNGLFPVSFSNTMANSASVMGDPSHHQHHVLRVGRLRRAADRFHPGRALGAQRNEEDLICSQVDNVVQTIPQLNKVSCGEPT